MASRGWSAGKTLLALPAAFMLGCVPTARLVVRALTGARIEELGNGKPGAANVHRSLGPGPGIAVLFIDVVKGYGLARWARHKGASPNVVGAVATAPVMANLLVVHGQGAATSLGAVYAIDEPAAVAVMLPLVAGVALRQNGLAAMAAALLYGPALKLLRRRPSPLWGLPVVAALAYGRLRGCGIGAATPTLAAVWQRFWFDREPDSGGDFDSRGRAERDA